eukprot:TRINITY_DN37912_c0_g2_i1.p1 TRINITY_DN37912_c0_g2~~TRINITY_DN37912_c0_g2_i1.p1  ORF type:complete len:680 (-),score=69.43 TRINITY_DN37912_c0_g2_i1:30-2069(-)
MTFTAALTHFGRGILSKFWTTYGWVDTTNKLLPNAVTSGFLVTYLITLLFLPFLLYILLRAVWAVADVGSTKKSMTTFLFIVLGLPLYPILTLLLNAILWLVIGVGGLTFAVLGPISLYLLLWFKLTDMKDDFLEKQYKLFRKRSRQGLEVQDLTCCELVWGLFVGIGCLFSFGLAAVVLTLLKSPLVLGSLLMRTIYRSVLWWLEFMKCCFCHKSWLDADADLEEPNLEVRASLTTIIDGVEHNMCDLKAAGWTAEDILRSSQFHARAQTLKDAGYSLRQLVDAGCSNSALQAAGFPPEPRESLIRAREIDTKWGESRLYMWIWFPLILLAWLIVLASGTCIVILGLAILVLVESIAAIVWPAWISSGWIRLATRDFGRRRRQDCCTPLTQGLKAGYQVLWVADVLLNACISGKPDLLQQIFQEFFEIAKGERMVFSAQCQTISPLPPVIVGLFQDSWDVRLRTIASKLGVSKDVVREAWRALARSMIILGRQAVDSDLITEDWVAEVPAELCLGLPARALLDTVERSPPEQMLLASGLRLTEQNRPKDSFSNSIWSYFKAAQAARQRLHVVPHNRDLLCAALLAGGGDCEALPEGLAKALRKYNEQPETSRAACQSVVQPLIAIAVECSRRVDFKEQLQLVIEGITSEGSSVHAFVTSDEFNAADSDDTDAGSSSEG